MGEQSEIRDLQSLLDRLAEAASQHDRVTVEQAINTVGRRSYGPVLLIPGLIALSPLSGIPGAPTMMGIMVLVIAGQILLGRSELWLPQFVLRRSVKRSRYEKALRLMRPVARLVDRLIKPRLHSLTYGLSLRLIAGFCLLVSLSAPLLEAVPFAVTGVGAAITAFGLALTASDGLLVLLTAGFCFATVTFVAVVLI